MFWFYSLSVITIVLACTHLFIVTSPEVLSSSPHTNTHTLPTTTGINNCACENIYDDDIDDRFDIYPQAHTAGVTIDLSPFPTNIIAGLESQSTISMIYSALNNIYMRSKIRGLMTSNELYAFNENLIKILEHNSDNTSTFKMAPNKFIAYSLDAFYKKYKIREYPQKLRRSNFRPHVSTGAPRNLDYRVNNVISVPRDQGPCGSCWAFAIVSSLESMYAIERGVDAQHFSVQQLLDCSSSDNSCGGGYLDSAMEFFLKNNTEPQNWLVLESNYREYTAKKLECKYKPQSHKHDVEYVGYYSINSGDEESVIQSLIKYGPIPVAIKVSQKLVFYDSGIFDDPNCNNGTVNHAVLLIGYGIEDGKRFWLLKNSWGIGWGERGYFRLSREIYNMCGIASNVIVPVLKLQG